MEHGPLMSHDLPFRRMVIFQFTTLNKQRDGMIRPWNLYWGQLDKDLAAAEADRCDVGRQDESWKWTLDVVQQWSAMHWFEMIYDNETIHDIII